MRAGIPAMLLAAGAVLGVTAGCGSAATSGAASGVATVMASGGGSTGSATAASTAGAGTGTGSVAGGFGTPQQVVTGFVQTELAGHWSKLCSYFPPAKRSGCSMAAGGMSGKKATGKLTVDGAVISGRRALVKVTGHVCLSGKSNCQSNSDPEAGMPGGSETFTQAYDKAVAGNAFSPLPCIKVKGRWYVNGSA